MADSDYPTPDDIHFAGLVQAATAAADESRSSSSLGKRKRRDENEIPIDESLLAPSGQGQDHMQLQNSAAVLFREPSMKSKKYSRPPLGKVYASLEVAPETFLKLQAAGKDFMLDPDHPERRDVVGHRRHSGGTDVAKLKLWNCVEQFLKDAGNGERFFAPGAGQGIPDAPERTMFWPEDAQKINKACMPLMRKMVTNERQRLYASDTRKSGATKENTLPQRHAESTTTENMTAPQDRKPEDDAHATTKHEGSVIDAEETAAPASSDHPGRQVTILVNVMKNDGQAQRRLLPRFSLDPSAADNLANFRQEIKKRLESKESSEGEVDKASVKVWMADGLVPILDDGQWMVAQLSAQTVEWMDGEVRVLVEL